MIISRNSVQGLLLFALFLFFAALVSCAPVAKPRTAEAPVAAPAPPSVYIEVNIPAMEMTVYEDGIPKFVKPVAIGSGVYPTPALESYISRIEWNPWWYPPPSDWAKDDKPTPPGPGNPLGLVKMPLSEGILFHGTNKERTVGTPASHGCMRMLNKDAVEVAWYLQNLFSDKTDPALLETYSKHRRKTYVVRLSSPVPAGLIYKPVILRGETLHFFPDYYRKLTRKEWAIREELLSAGIEEDCIDGHKVAETARHWPRKGTEIGFKDFIDERCKQPIKKENVQRRRLK